MKLVPVLLGTLRHGACFIIMVTLLEVIGEEFPFSHFPMYGLLPNHTMCMQVTDGEDHIIPVNYAFGAPITAMKQQVVTETRTLMKAKGMDKKTEEVPLAIRQEAGARVLKRLITYYKPTDPKMKGKTIRLRQVDFTVKKRQVVRTVETLAEDTL